MKEKNPFSLLIRYLLRFHRDEDSTAVWNSPFSRKMLQEQWDQAELDARTYRDDPVLDRMYLRIREQIRTNQDCQAERKPFLAGNGLLKPVFQLAALVLLLLIPARIFYFGEAGSAKNIQRLLTCEVPAGERTRIILPDHTLVWLNAGSRIHYPEKFGAGDRQVGLEGEAFFDVIHNPQKPFIVNTPHSVIRVLGTRFNACDYPGEDISETILVDGRVEVRPENRQMYYILQPDQKWIYDAGQDHARVLSTDSEEYMAWISGKIIFANSLLEEICQRLEHWYGCHFVIDPALLGKYHLTLTVRDESVATIMHLLSKTIPMDWEQVPGVLPDKSPVFKIKPSL